jgi:hypothetical protein
VPHKQMLVCKLSSAGSARSNCTRQHSRRTTCKAAVEQSDEPVSRGPHMQACSCWCFRWLCTQLLYKAAQPQDNQYGSMYAACLGTLSCAAYAGILSGMGGVGRAMQSVYQAVQPPHSP